VQFRLTAVLRSSETAIVAILSRDASQNGQAMAIAQKNARELKEILAAKNVGDAAKGWHTLEPQEHG
jgi:hypothetical protein